MVTTLYFHCWGPGFEPWWGNQNPASLALRPKIIIIIKDTNELIYKINRPTDIENKLTVTKGERRGRDILGVWD